MNPFDYFKKCLTSGFADFNGRARRSEFWYFVLFFMILVSIASILSLTLYYIIYFAMLIPYIAVTARRMHDVGKSGWFMLIPFYNIYLACLDSEPGKNEYGPNPKTGISEDLHDHLV